MNILEQVSQVDFWQHMTIASYIYVGLWALMSPKLQLYKSKNRTVFLYTMVVALLHEFLEYFWNFDSYENMTHYLLDSMTDLGAALISCFFFAIILKDKQ